MSTGTQHEPQRIGRYILFEKIASGGMATVHFGLMLGDEGFSRVVAIKRVRPDKRASEGFVDSLLDEARLASRVKHPNVVPPLDVLWHDGELLMVLEYVAGESLSSLLRIMAEREETIPLRIGATIIAQVLHGLHAAHNAKSAAGKPLGIVHRDVSPQNVLVGRDGLARILDFGIAKASERVAQSIEGQVKGKLAYLSPEQLKGTSDRRTDVYATAIVFWEVLAQRRLFQAKTTMEMFKKVVDRSIEPPSTHREEVSAELDAIVMKALSFDKGDRFPTARRFALAIEDCVGVVSSAQISDWIERVAGESLERRVEVIARLERRGADLGAPTLSPASLEPTTHRVESLPTSTVPHPVPDRRREGADLRPQPSSVDTEVDHSSPDGTTGVPVDEVFDAPTQVSHEPEPATHRHAIEDPETRLSASPDSDDTTRVETTTVEDEATAIAFAPQPSAPTSQGPGEASVEALTPLSGGGSDVPSQAEPSRRAHRWLGAVVFALLGAGVAWFTIELREAPEPAGEAPSIPVAPVVAATSETPPPPPPPAPSSVSSSAPSSSVAPAAPVAPPQSHPPPPVVAPPSPRPECVPPYTIDERGIRRLKPQCL